MYKKESFEDVKHISTCTPDVARYFDPLSPFIPKNTTV